MPDLIAPSNQAKLVEATSSVFETMIPLPLEVLGTEPGIPTQITGEILAILGYTGTHVGSFVISLSNKAAKSITAALLMMEEDEVSDEDVCDAIGEVANMIGGNFKNHLIEYGLEVHLASPHTIQGVALQTKIPKETGGGFASKFKIAGEPFNVIFFYK